jgi:hypothetical protein
MKSKLTAVAKGLKCLNQMDSKVDEEYGLAMVYRHKKPGIIEYG